MPILSSFGSGGLGGWKGAGGPAALYAFTSHTFTTTGLVGRGGPTLSQMQTAYNGAPWASNTAYLSLGRAQGYQVWTVPATKTYEITAVGARGQNSASALGYGQGCIIRGRVALTAGDKLEIVVGQVPGNSGAENPGNGYSGAGGGTFVVYNGTVTPLFIAGGGGGIYSSWNGIQRDYNGQTYRIPTWTGNHGGLTSGAYTTAGFGGMGYHGGGGGGLLGSGQHFAGFANSSGMGTSGSFQQYTLGAGFNGVDLSGSSWGGPWYATGGSATALTSEGGFGGGGGGHSGANSAGAGGGYTGGVAGVSTVSAGSYNSGIGGGSFIISSATAVATSDGMYDGSTTFNGSSITNLSSYNVSGSPQSGNGYVIITAI